MNDDKIMSWISQFQATEQAAIRDLLLSFNGVDTIKMQDDLREYLLDEIDILESGQTQILIESIISEEDVKKLYQNRKAGSYPLVDANENYNKDPRRSMTFKYKAYVDYLPENQRNKKSGSELYIDSVQRTVSKHYIKDHNKNFLSKDYKKLLGQPKNLRAFLLTDNIGSGRQARTFLHSFLAGLREYANPKKNIKITVVTWCATRSSVSTLKRCIDLLREDAGDAFSKLELDFKFFNYSRTLEDLKDPEKRESIRTILQGISSDTYRKGETSYDEVNTLTVVEGHQCSNTTPYVFYESVNGNDLFPGRFVEKGFLDTIRMHLRKNPDQIIFRNPAETLAFNNKLKTAWKAANFYQEVFWLRLIYAQLGYSSEESFGLIQIGYRPLTDAVKILIRSGYMEPGERGAITEEGRRALSRYGKRTRYRLMRDRGQYSTKIFDAKEIVYYPYSVNGVS